MTFISMIVQPWNETFWKRLIHKMRDFQKLWTPRQYCNVSYCNVLYVYAVRILQPKKSTWKERCLQSQVLRSWEILDLRLFVQMKFSTLVCGFCTLNEAGVLEKNSARSRNQVLNHNAYTYGAELSNHKYNIPWLSGTWCWKNFIGAAAFVSFRYNFLTLKRKRLK